MAAALLFLGVLFFFQKSVKPLVSLMLVLGAFALAAGAFAFSGSDERESTPPPQELSIEVVSPAEGETVAANEKVTLEVEITGGSLTSESESEDPTEGHLHIYIDDELVSMPSTETPEVRFKPGEHVLTVEFTEADHHSFDPRVLDEVTITAE